MMVLVVCSVCVCVCGGGGGGGGRDNKLLSQVQPVALIDNEIS